MNRAHAKFWSGCLIAAFLFYVVVVLHASSAADLQGRWVANMTGDGKAFSFIFNFKVSGDALTGTMELSTRDDVFPIKDGKIKGNDISFTAFGAWTGTLEGSELKLTRGLDYGKKQHMVAHRAAGDHK